MTRNQQIIKRSLDVAGAVLGLLVLLPVFLLVALAIRLTMGSPVLFRQQRPGWRGRPFTLLKFRSMTEARDAAGEWLPDGDRLTCVGRFLRQTSLDELPQLWNVLKGEMSLVGPRPLLMKYQPFYTERERKRFEVLPGITGWAQVSGRNDLVWNDRLGCDVWYVEHYSLRLDCRILWITALKVLRRDNVQVDPMSTGADLDEARSSRLAEATGGSAVAVLPREQYR